MDGIDEVTFRLEAARSVCVLTGAGVSAESGVPTFRGGGETAVWKGMPFDRISSAAMVREDLDEVWEWFDYRRGVLAGCKPNPAHEALASWEDRFVEMTLVTQNVDGLHERAGSSNVIEIHGNINRSICLRCGEVFQMKPDEVPHRPEVCLRCEASVRPDVVLFGEALPEGAYELAIEAASGCDIFFVIGTSSLVYPAAMLPQTAQDNGAFLVEVNPEITPLSRSCDISLRKRAGEAVPEF